MRGMDRSEYSRRLSDYLAARALAERTLHVNDLVEAGRAWARFMRLFSRRGRSRKETTETERPTTRAG